MLELDCAAPCTSDHPWREQQYGRFRANPLLAGPASPATALPILAVAAGYDPLQLSVALADLPICLLVRLRAGRCFDADPTSQPQTGRPRRPGANCVGADATTWSTPRAPPYVGSPARTRQNSADGHRVGPQASAFRLPHAAGSSRERSHGYRTTSGTQPPGASNPCSRLHGSRACIRHGQGPRLRAGGIG